jgi:ATP-dependent DNA helicase RecG
MQKDFHIDIPTLLAQGMGADLHWFLEGADISKLAATLVAMANTDGGVVVLGVTPRTGRIQGVKEIDKEIDRVFQAALLSDPPLVLPVPQVHRIGLDSVVVVNVPPGLPHVYNLEGRYLWRDGFYTSPLSARHLRELLQERGVIQFEARVPHRATLKDLDLEQVEAYLGALKLSSEEKWEQVLVRRGCLQKDGKKMKPTYAALLLFGRNPQQWLPNASIMAARFPGTSFADEFLKQDISGTLPQQIRAAELFLRDNLRSVVRVIGLTHQETSEYPVEAVRELLVNAVAHRDYNSQGDNIHLHIFADRLEIHSPGGLPGPINLKNLLKARFSRNAVIAQVLSDLGFVERLGYGLNRVVTAMRQNGLRPPYFEEVGGSFRVTLYGEVFQSKMVPDVSKYQDLELNTRQRVALSHLLSHNRITNSIYQELCPDVHPETLRRDFADLVSRGILIKMGSKRATYYILKDKGG